MMNRTAWLQDRRMQKFRDVLSRWERGALSMMEAGELLGMSERQFRRYRDRYEEDGLDGLIDRRLGKPSPKRVPALDLRRVLELYRDCYRGWNVKHFHEHLVRDHNWQWGYTWVKTQLHAAGLVDRAKRRGAHRRKRERKPCAGMMLHQDGSRAAWLEGQPMLDLIVTMDDATSTLYSAFLAEEEGTASTFQALVEVFTRTRPAGEPLYRPRQSLLLHGEGRRGGRQGAAHAGRPGAQAAGHRAHSGLFAGGAGPFGAHVRHPAGSAAQGVEAGRHQRHGICQPLHPRGLSAGAQCALCQGCSAARERLCGRCPGAVARHLCVQEERIVARDNTVAYGGLRLQLPQSPLRAHYVKARVRVHQYPDGGLAVFHGPRPIARYTSEGVLIEVEPSKLAA